MVSVGVMLPHLHIDENTHESKFTLLLIEMIHNFTFGLPISSHPRDNYILNQYPFKSFKYHTNCEIHISEHVGTVALRNCNKCMSDAHRWHVTAITFSIIIPCQILYIFIKVNQNIIVDVFYNHRLVDFAVRIEMQKL